MCVTLSMLKAGLNFHRVIEIHRGSGRREIVGYYALWPLEYKIYNKLARGTLDETEIKPTDLLPFGSPHIDALYILEVTIDKRFGLGRFLLADMAKEIKRRLEENPAINKVGAWAFSRDGLKWAQTLGLALVSLEPERKNYDFYETTRDALFDLASQEGSVLGRLLR